MKESVRSNPKPPGVRYARSTNFGTQKRGMTAGSAKEGAPIRRAAPHPQQQRLYVAKARPDSCPHQRNRQPSDSLSRQTRSTPAPTSKEMLAALPRGLASVLAQRPIPNWHCQRADGVPSARPNPNTWLPSLIHRQMPTLPHLQPNGCMGTTVEPSRPSAGDPPLSAPRHQMNCRCRRRAKG